jgi:hypothetical protein
LYVSFHDVLLPRSVVRTVQSATGGIVALLIVLAIGHYNVTYGIVAGLFFLFTVYMTGQTSLEHLDMDKQLMLENAIIADFNARDKSNNSEISKKELHPEKPGSNFTDKEKKNIHEKHSELNKIVRWALGKGDKPTIKTPPEPTVPIHTHAKITNVPTHPHANIVDIAKQSFKKQKDLQAASQTQLQQRAAQLTQAVAAAYAKTAGSPTPAAAMPQAAQEAQATQSLTGCKTRNDGGHGVYRYGNPAAMAPWNVESNTTDWDRECAKVDKANCGVNPNHRCAWYGNLTAAQAAQAAPADDGFREYSAANPLTCNSHQSVVEASSKSDCAAKIKEKRLNGQYLFGSYFDVRNNKICRYGTGKTSDEAQGCGKKTKNVGNWGACNHSNNKNPDIHCYNMILDRTGQPQLNPSTYIGN